MQGSHATWKTWKIRKAFSSHGKVMEFYHFSKNLENTWNLISEPGKVMEFDFSEPGKVMEFHQFDLFYMIFQTKMSSFVIVFYHK